MPKQINTIINGKGGVGKSFFAVNLVQCLKDHSIAHVAIDTHGQRKLDPQTVSSRSDVSRHRGHERDRHNSRVPGKEPNGQRSWIVRMNVCTLSEAMGQKLSKARERQAPLFLVEYTNRQSYIEAN